MEYTFKNKLNKEKLEFYRERYETTQEKIYKMMLCYIQYDYIEDEYGDEVYERVEFKKGKQYKKDKEEVKKLKDKLSKYLDKMHKYGMSNEEIDKFTIAFDEEYFEQNDIEGELKDDFIDECW